MGLHTWWLDDPAQRYWMEITHRPDEDIGTNLWCPVRDVWSDQLASWVRPGDQVLHWKAWEADREPSLVGWSKAMQEPRVIADDHDYYDDGDYYDDDSDSSPDTWFVVLDGLRRFRRPVSSSSLLAEIDQLMDVKAALEDAYGKPIYFPFIRYRRRELRAQQGYLTKFPAELFEVIPGIRSASR
ncbi:EVE domain-containing protein [Mycobacterium sp. SMC-4]|uniref:EVE domain-containing protein n=1 Tax=Mycobacterium sp. SMC-4 TaxID=2857059 RepID=UPI0021B27ACC|nr:EVE domain-containing protein [Mycobacterium sp. SMC-4]UXA18805.1 EVE domain-containing protein [Mycobacterium sp. SMC-4]